MSVKDDVSNNVVADGATDEMKKMSLRDDFIVVRGITGKVKWFSPHEGYGFITRDDNGKDIFVHYSNIVRSGRSLHALSEGDQVEFDITQGMKGLEASTVTAPGGKLIKGICYIRAPGFRRNYHSSMGFRKNRNREDNNIKHKKLDADDNNNVSVKAKSDSVENVKKARNNRKQSSRKAGNHGEKDDRKTSKSASAETVAESGECAKKEMAAVQASESPVAESSDA